jgi:hypothetical protein
MKLNNKGWGYRMMFFLMSLLIICLFVATYYIYKYYDSIGNNNSYVTSGER